MGTVEPKELFLWRQEYSVGVEELDNHHKEMSRLINKFHDAMESNTGTQKIMDVIAELFDYANYHFGAEEALFHVIDFPFEQDHCEKHLAFRKNLTERRDMVGAGIDSASVDLYSYLNLWWSNHILQEDKKYAPYFKD